MSLAVQPNSYVEEIVDLQRILVDAQERLSKLMRLEKRGISALETRSAEAEARNVELLNSAKWLRVQNAELERKLATQKPELENALAARDSALKKMEHMRRVLKDLLEERLKASEHASNLAISGDTNDIDEALLEEVLASSEDSPTTDSDSKTIRRDSTDFEQPVAGPSERHGFEDILDLDQLEYQSLDSDPRSSISVHHSGPEPDDNVWNIQMEAPPGCGQVTSPPLSENDIQMYLNLSDHTMDMIRSLESQSALYLRLYISRDPEQGNMAFLYDPMFLEKRTSTVLMEYGEPDDNEEMVKYITQDLGPNQVLHTFTYPRDKKSWFYVGALTWRVIKPIIVWKTLPKESRSAIFTRLRIRSQLQLEEEDAETLLDDSGLVEFCVELSSASNKRATEQFMRRLEKRSYGGETKSKTYGKTPLNKAE